MNNRKSYFWARYRALVERCSTPGIMPPRLPRLSFLLRLIARTWVWLQVGKVEIVRRENLFPSPTAKVILCPNHSSYFDALILSALLPYRARYMAAHDQFTGLGGIRALVMAAGGAFAVDRSKGANVIGIATTALVEEHALVIFPEARINSDGRLGEFKTGLYRIGSGAQERLQDSGKVYLVPIQFCYALRDAASAQGGYGLMGLKWRHGVKMNVGRPVEFSEVAGLTPAAASALLRQKIIEIGPCPTLPDTLNGKL